MNLCDTEGCTIPINKNPHRCDDCLLKIERSRENTEKAYALARANDPFYEDDFLLFAELSEMLGCEENDDDDGVGDIYWRKMIISEILFKSYYNFDKNEICVGPTLSRTELLFKHLADLKKSSVNFVEHQSETMHDTIDSIKEAILNYRILLAFVKVWVEKSEIIKKQHLVTGLTEVVDVNNIVKKYLINM